MKVNEEIKSMILSEDKDSRYLAVCMLREDVSNSFNYSTKKLINKVNIFERIKSYSDVCKELDIQELTIKDFDFLPKEQRKKQLAYSKIQNICKLFNEDWIPNWKNSSEYKYYPYFIHPGSGGLVFSGSPDADSHCPFGVGFFKSREISDFVGKTFIDIYKDLL